MIDWAVNEFPRRCFYEWCEGFIHLVQALVKNEIDHRGGSGKILVSIAFWVCTFHSEDAKTSLHAIPDGFSGRVRIFGFEGRKRLKGFVTAC